MSEPAVDSPEVAINHEKLIDVFDTNDESEALVVRGLLEASGIEVLMSSREAPPGTLSFSHAPLGHMQMEVFESDAAQARDLIEQYRQSGQQEISEQPDE